MRLEWEADQITNSTMPLATASGNLMMVYARLACGLLQVAAFISPPGH